jgi:hypothetical protein
MAPVRVCALMLRCITRASGAWRVRCASCCNTPATPHPLPHPNVEIIAAGAAHMASGQQADAEGGCGMERRLVPGARGTSRCGWSHPSEHCAWCRAAGMADDECTEGQLIRGRTLRSHPERVELGRLVCVIVRAVV